MRRLARYAIVLLSAVPIGGILGGATPASAQETTRHAGRVVLHGIFEDTYEFSDETCGFRLDVVETVWVQVVIRATEGGQAFLGAETARFHAIVTNPETGLWFVVRGHRRLNEIHATHIEGNIYELDVIEAGQPFIVEDAEGNVLVRDRGLIRHTVIFDTLGDGQPGGIHLDVTDVFHGVFVDFDFCEAAAELTGAMRG